MPSPRPPISELRSVCQPEWLLGRRSGEHWAGRLYMRRISLRVTRWLVGTRATPNVLTGLMIVAGLCAAVLVAVPGVATAVGGAVLIQMYLLLDCVDGEVARWRQTSSASGVYLDRLGHQVVEAGLLVGLGVRAAGGPSTEASWWVALGAVAAVLAVVARSESDLVTVARAESGLTPPRGEDSPSSIGTVRRLRRLFDLIPLHRSLGAVELSLLIAAAAVADALTGTLVPTQGLLVVVAATALIVAVGHPITIMTSGRLR